MPHDHRRTFQLLRSLAPCSLFLLPLAAVAQTVPGPEQTASETPALAGTPTTVADSPTGDAAAVLTPETSQDPPPSAAPMEATLPPSYYGSSELSGTSVLEEPEGGSDFLDAPGDLIDSLEENPLRWGPFTAHVRAAYRFSYASRVREEPGRSTDTAMHTVTPGISLVSQHLSLSYRPSLRYYSKGNYEDSINHNASLAAHFGYGDWRFRLSQHYRNSSSVLVETARQTETTSHSTHFDASWLFSEKVFFDFTFAQRFQDSAGFRSSKSWSTMEWANYRLTPQFSVGGGIGGGYLAVDEGSNSTYEEVQGRVNWSPSPRLRVHLNGGLEIRQFLDIPDSGNLVNPIMGASVSYHLFEHTALHLNANRGVNNSLFSDQITERTSISAGVNQRLFGRFNLGVNAGVRMSDYRSTAAANLALARSDTHTFIATRISTRILKRGNLSFSYRHSENTTDAEGFGFSSDQFTTGFSYGF